MEKKKKCFPPGISSNKLEMQKIVSYFESKLPKYLVWSDKTFFDNEIFFLNVHFYDYLVCI